MTTSPFGRILWKEARAQFGLWLALVLGAFLLQTLIVATGRHVAYTSQSVTAVIFVLSCCFTVASIALLFAGETEEGTRDWLRQLPIRPRTLIGAKLTFTVIATLLYFIAVFATGALAMAFDGRPIEELFRADLLEQIRIGKSYAGICIWGLLFALVCRRVMFALLGTVIAQLLTVAITDNLYGHGLLVESFDPRTVDLARTISYSAVLAIVFVFDVVLAYRWANGGSSSVSIAPRATRHLSLPLAEWRQRTWLRLITWAAQRGSLSARETAVLAWREIRGAVPFAVVWCLVGILVTDVLSRFTGAFWRENPFQLLFLIVTPALCGLLTCLGDQRQQTYRFLAERGVSPVRVWVIKQVVWMVLAVVFVVAFLRWDTASAERFRATGQVDNLSLVIRAIASMHVPVLAPPPAGHWSFEDVSLQNDFLWATGFLLFAAGQAAGFWIRRSILAMAALIVAIPAVIAWNTVLVHTDIPLSLATWPLTLALMAATLIGASAWLRGRDSWKLRFVRLAAVALPVCAVATVAAAHRAYSIPKVDSDFPFPDAADLYRFNMRSVVPDPAWSQQWRLLARPAIHDPFGRTRYTPPPLPELANQRLTLLSLAARINAGAPHLDPLVLSPDQMVLVPRLMDALTSDEAVAFEAARSQVDLSAAGRWPDFEAGLDITRYLAEESQSAEQWMQCLRARQPIFRAIVEWSRRADQTPETLQHAFDYLAKDMVRPITAREMAVNRYAFYSQLLQHRGSKWDAIASDIQKFGQIDVAAANSAIAAALQPGFERERVLRLLGHTTLAFLSHRDSIVDALQPQGLQIQRWAASTPLLPMNVTTELYSEAYSPAAYMPMTLNGVFQSVHTQKSGTTLVVALQCYRLQHGEFPARLSEAIPPQWNASGWPFTDQHTHSQFGYEPKGLPADLYLAGGRVLRAGQPLLWSAGFGNGSLSEITTARGVGGDAANPMQPTIPMGAYIATGNDLRMPQGDFHYVEARPDQVEFINAGMQPSW